MPFLDSHLLSILIWLPILGGILVLATGDDRNAAMARKIGFGFAVATFLLSLSLYRNFDLTTADMQFVEKMSWINIFDIQYFLGVDGISVPLILLTTFLTVIVVVAGWEVVQERTAQYFAAFLLWKGLWWGFLVLLMASFFIYSGKQC